MHRVVADITLLNAKSYHGHEYACVPFSVCSSHGEITGCWCSLSISNKAIANTASATNRGPSLIGSEGVKLCTTKGHGRVCFERVWAVVQQDTRMRSGAVELGVPDCTCMHHPSIMRSSTSTRKQNLHAGDEGSNGKCREIGGSKGGFALGSAWSVLRRIGQQDCAI
ncbi:hypothetical protein K504DRAFT_63331 [Pleomassaria siparia CBS 279.74]|uniref:Uncharacterized protein n=1 Tax=Pleomassaria siparia CBS 279.74 TaxID=1314801 RepID=A0A6G1K1N2_9PLEO|nr:hypothetical protein K504DRAFT_63331 [Pleomassaria siparia CBS 279.74]